MPIKKVFLGEPEMSELSTYINSEKKLYIEIKTEDVECPAWICLSIQDAKELILHLHKEIKSLQNGKTS